MSGDDHAAAGHILRRTHSAVSNTHMPNATSHSPNRLHSYKVVEHGLRHLRSYRTFRENTARINHMDYSHDGRQLITSSDDDSLVVYDCEKQTKVQTVHSRKYGACLIQFASDNKSVIHASTKVDNTIRYLSIDKSSYIRYFQGHVKRVRSLSMSPTDEVFISCSLDNTMRLWDLRTQPCQGSLNNSSAAIAAFDRTGMAFGIAFGAKMLKLFDIRQYAAGPFLSINLPPDCHHEVSNMQFSPNNKLLVLGTRSDELYVLDTYESRFLHKLRGHRNDTNINLKPTFAPGSRHVLCGSTDGYLNVYSISEGNIVKRYRTSHNAPIENVLFSRRYFLLNTSCVELQTWLPSLTPETSGAPRH